MRKDRGRRKHTPAQVFPGEGTHHCPCTTPQPQRQGDAGEEK